MDRSHAQDDYFTSFSRVINDLDPKSAEFEFQHTNLRNAVQISKLLTSTQKQDLKSMLHIVYLRSRD